MEREQKEQIIADLHKKMVLLCGPRQCGKTTLARAIGDAFPSSIYLNFDVVEDRELIIKRGWLPSVELVILDEIHKMHQWKNYLKGVYDGRLEHQKFLVTGSARLELFTQAGDSLAGRYFLHRLFPLSPAESAHVGESFSLAHFLERGGFPEPFLAQSAVDAKRWRQHYIDTLLTTDVLDFDQIRNVKAIRQLFELLRHRVGSPISYSALGEDLALSPHTVKRYIEILEALYIVFRVIPFSRNIARSLLKEPKLYFFDVPLVKGDAGKRLENLVALSLLKWTHLKIDREGEPWALHYLRTKEGREVDFALVWEEKLRKILEVKLSDETISQGLHHFHQKYAIPAAQVVYHARTERLDRGIEVRSAESFLCDL